MKVCMNMTEKDHEKTAGGFTLIPQPVRIEAVKLRNDVPVNVMS